MKKNKKYIVVILMVFCSFSSLCQEIDQKYLISLLYLKSNDSLDKEIRTFFKVKVPKKSYTPYKIHGKINFIDIEVFKDELKNHSNDSLFDLNIFNKVNGYRNKYNFESEHNDFSKLLPVQNDGLTIIYSKPVGNLLAMELAYSDIISTKIKLGSRYRILFMFDHEGFVKKIFTKIFHFN